MSLTFNDDNRAIGTLRMDLECDSRARMPVPLTGFEEGFAHNARLLQRLPIVGTVARQVMLLTLAGDLDGARWHLRRLLKFAPPSTDEAITDMRRIIQGHPERLAPLGRALDEELAAAPERRWWRTAK